MPNRSSVLFGPLGPVIQSTREVGAPAIEAGGGPGGGGAGWGAGWGAGCGAALGRNSVAFGGGWAPGWGGLGGGCPSVFGRTWFCCWIGAEYRVVPGLSKLEISGPNLGSGARSFVLLGRRPVGGRTTGAGASTGAAEAGGSMFASGASQGVAYAGGATPIATTRPRAATDATEAETIRGNADNVTPFTGPDAALTPAVAHVTIEICGTLVTSDSTIGIHLRPCRDPIGSVRSLLRPLLRVLLRERQVSGLASSAFRKTIRRARVTGLCHRHRHGQRP
jgi:hypothetical protein